MSLLDFPGTGWWRGLGVDRGKHGGGGGDELHGRLWLNAQVTLADLFYVDVDLGGRQAAREKLRRFG